MTRLQNIVAAASRTLGRVLDIVCGCLTMAIVGLTLAQVFSRYVLDLSLIWSDELVRLLFVWMIVLAAASARHMRIEFFTLSRSMRTRRILGVFALTVSLACLGVLAYGARSLWSILRYDTYTSMPISPGLLFMAAGLGAVLWAVFMISRSLVRRGDIAAFDATDGQDA